MAARALATRAEISTQLAELLSPEHELFANELASGVTITEAAERIGVSGTYGSRLLERPDINSRLDVLLLERSTQGFPSRSWVEAQMVTQYRRVANLKLGDKGLDDAIKQATAAVSMLNSISKLKGFIVEKSAKLSAKLDLNKATASQITAAFTERLDNLSPGARAQLELMAKAEVVDEDEGSGEAE